MRNPNQSKNRVAALCLLAVLLGQPSRSAEKVTPLLSDGLVLPAVDGRVVRDVNEGTWRFTLSADRVLGKIRIPRGTQYELLPGHALAALATDVERRSSFTYRLWARVTHYRGRNYLYLTPSYFIPLVAKETVPAGVADRALRDPNQSEAVGIPADILAMMEEQRAIAGGPDAPRIVIPEDELLLGRRATLERDRERTWLVLDGLGQNLSRERFILLPSAVRQRMEEQQAWSADRLYFRVGGVWTRYREQSYLLLHQAVRLHGHGNFRRH